MVARKSLWRLRCATGHSQGRPRWRPGPATPAYCRMRFARSSPCRPSTSRRNQSCRSALQRFLGFWLRLLRVLIQFNNKGNRMKYKTTLITMVAAVALIAQAIAADSYTVDPAHSRVGFSARHFGISNVKGSFKEFAGKVVMDGDALKEATATIQVQSIDTGVAQRDNHLTKTAFCDPAAYQTIQYKTTHGETKGEQLIMTAHF